MNGRYLCRAKRADTGEWVEGYYLKFRDPIYAYVEEYEKSRVPDRHYIMYAPAGYVEDWHLPGGPAATSIDPSTLCQRTGLADKNGNAIWENDIMMARLDDSYPDNITYAKVVWGGFSWHLAEQYECNEPMEGRDLRVFEVCGNIFDTPGLLEGGASNGRKEM